MRKYWLNELKKQALKREPVFLSYDGIGVSVGRAYPLL